jgi:hypothetical protein
MRHSFRPTAPPRSDSDAPPSAGRYDQEFLYHLYRGSELLQDNAVDEAKAELERALALQPRDSEGQGLLGVVYFRLGMYPMAIEIFEQLERSNPREVTPKINLALCYLKTGQGEAARECLEAVITAAPKHKRAWGYLGLVYQRFGEFEKAKIAFERAGHPKLAERMALLISQVEATDGSGFEVPEIDAAALSARPTTLSARPSMRPSLGQPIPTPTIPPPPDIAAPASVRPSSGNSEHAGLAAPPLPRTTNALGEGFSEASSGVLAGPGSRRIHLPEPIARVVREAELIFPENPKVAQNADGSVLVRIDTSFAVRPQWIAALSYHRVPFSTQTLRRKSATGNTAEPLGGAAPLVSLVGSGRMLLAPHPDLRLLLFTVDREPLYLRESHLVGFQPQVNYESGRLDPSASSEVVTKVSGAGAVVAYSRGALATLPVSTDSPLCLRSGQVLGWFGRLLPRMIPAAEAPAGLTAMLGFSGHGSVLIDLG